MPVGVPEFAIAFFFFGFGVYCLQFSLQDITVLLEHNYETQDKIDNRMSGWLDVNKTEGVKHLRHVRPDQEKKIMEGQGEQARDGAENYYEEEKWQALQHPSQSRIDDVMNGP